MFSWNSCFLDDPVDVGNLISGSSAFSKTIWKFTVHILLRPGLENFEHYFTSIWRRQWHPTPVLLPGKSHGRRNLEGCSPWGHWGSDTTERLHFHFLLSYIGEGNGNPLQCSCLENPRDGGAWWAASYGVAQSPTLLKWLSSSSIRYLFFSFWLTSLCVISLGSFTSLERTHVFLLWLSNIPLWI